MDTETVLKNLIVDGGSFPVLKLLQEKQFTLDGVEEFPKLKPMQYLNENCMTTEERHKLLCKQQGRMRCYSGPCTEVKIEPPVVVFQSYKYGETYRFPIVVRNSHKRSQKVLLLMNETYAFKFDDCSQRIAKLPCGMCITATVLFTPDSDSGDYFHKLVVATNSARVTVPIIALGSRPILNAPDSLALLDSAVRHWTVKPVTVLNVGKKPARFTMNTTGPFCVKPDKGVVNPNYAFTFEVAYFSKAIASHDGEICIKYDNGEEVFMDLKANAINYDIKLSSPDVRCEDTFFGLQTRVVIYIENRSKITAKFIWKKRRSAIKSFSEPEPDERFEPLEVDNDEFAAHVLDLYEEEESISIAEEEEEVEEDEEEEKKASMVEEEKKISIAEEKKISNSGTEKKISNAGTENRISNSGTEKKISNSCSEKKISSSGSEKKISNAGTEKRIRNSGSGKKISNSGSEKKASNSGTENRISNAGTENRISNAGTEKRISNAGTENRNSNAGTENRISNAGTENRNSNAGTENRISNAGTENRISNAGTEKKISNAGTEKRISNSGTEKKASNSGSEKKISNSGTEKKASNSGSEKKASNSGTEKRISTAGTEKRISTAGTEKRISTAGTEKRISNAGTKKKISNSCTEQKISSAGIETKTSNAGAEEKKISIAGEVEVQIEEEEDEEEKPEVEALQDDPIEEEEEEEELKTPSTKADEFRSELINFSEIASKLNDNINEDNERNGLELDEMFRDKAFHIYPLFGDVKPNSRAEVHIVFTPNECTFYENTAFLDITGLENRIPFPLFGRGLGPKFKLGFDVLKVGDVKTGQSYTYEVPVQNISEIPGVIQYDSLVGSSSGMEIKVEPALLSLAPSQYSAFYMSFNCTGSGKVGTFEDEIKFSSKESVETYYITIRGSVDFPDTKAFAK